MSYDTAPLFFEKNIVFCKLFSFCCVIVIDSSKATRKLVELFLNHSIPPRQPSVVITRGCPLFMTHGLPGS